MAKLNLFLPLREVVQAVVILYSTLIIIIFFNYYYFLNLFIYFHLFGCVGSSFLRARGFSSCGERGPLFIAVRGPLTVAASLVVEHRLQTRRLSSCGSGAQSLRSMWDPPRPGLEPVSPALTGRFSTTAPPGKPNSNYLCLPHLGHFTRS